MKTQIQIQGREGKERRERYEREQQKLLSAQNRLSESGLLQR